MSNTADYSDYSGSYYDSYGDEESYTGSYTGDYTGSYTASESVKRAGGKPPPPPSSPTATPAIAEGGSGSKSKSAPPAKTGGGADDDDEGSYSYSYSYDEEDGESGEDGYSSYGYSTGYSGSSGYDSYGYSGSGSSPGSASVNAVTAPPLPPSGSKQAAGDAANDATRSSDVYSYSYSYSDEEGGAGTDEYSYSYSGSGDGSSGYSSYGYGSYSEEGQDATGEGSTDYADYSGYTEDSLSYGYSGSTSGYYDDYYSSYPYSDSYGYSGESGYSSYTGDEEGTYSSYYYGSGSYPYSDSYGEETYGYSDSYEGYTGSSSDYYTSSGASRSDGGSGSSYYGYSYSSSGYGTYSESVTVDKSLSSTTSSYGYSGEETSSSDSATESVEAVRELIILRTPARELPRVPPAPKRCFITPHAAEDVVSAFLTKLMAVQFGYEAQRQAKDAPLTVEEDWTTKEMKAAAKQRERELKKQQKEARKAGVSEEEEAGVFTPTPEGHFSYRSVRFALSVLRLSQFERRQALKGCAMPMPEGTLYSILNRLVASRVSAKLNEAFLAHDTYLTGELPLTTVAQLLRRVGIAASPVIEGTRINIAASPDRQPEMVLIVDNCLTPEVAPAAAVTTAAAVGTERRDPRSPSASVRSLHAEESQEKNEKHSHTTTLNVARAETATRSAAAVADDGAKNSEETVSVARGPTPPSHVSPAPLWQASPPLYVCRIIRDGIAAKQPVSVRWANETVYMGHHVVARGIRSEANFQQLKTYIEAATYVCVLVQLYAIHEGNNRCTVQYPYLLHSLLSATAAKDSPTHGNDGDGGARRTKKSVFTESLFRGLFLPMEWLEGFASGHQLAIPFFAGKVAVESTLQATVETDEMRRRNVVPTTTEDYVSFLPTPAKAEGDVAVELLVEAVALPGVVPRGARCYCLVSAVTTDDVFLPAVRLPAKASPAKKKKKDGTVWSTWAVGAKAEEKAPHGGKKHSPALFFAGPGVDRLYVECCYETQEDVHVETGTSMDGDDKASDRAEGTQRQTSVWCAGYAAVPFAELRTGKLAVKEGSLLDDELRSQPTAPPTAAVAAEGTGDAAAASPKKKRGLPCSLNCLTLLKQSGGEKKNKKKKNAAQTATYVTVKLLHSKPKELPEGKDMPRRYLILKRHLRLIALLRQAILHVGEHCAYAAQALRQQSVRRVFTVAADVQLLDQLELLWQFKLKQMSKEDKKNAAKQHEELLQCATALAALYNCGPAAERGEFARLLIKQKPLSTASDDTAPQLPVEV